MKNAPGKKHDVKSAAEFLGATYGTTVSPRSFSRLDIPYRVILKRRIYLESDLAAWAEQQFANAPRRIGGSGD